jgi:ribonuclease BN (tRNA processing enzyme)
MVVDAERQRAYHCHAMPILTVRISAAEQEQLTRRAKQSGISPGALVRRLLNEHPFTTAAELLKALEQRMGDKRLRVSRKK